MVHFNVKIFFLSISGLLKNLKESIFFSDFGREKPAQQKCVEWEGLGWVGIRLKLQPQKILFCNGGWIHSNFFYGESKFKQNKMRKSISNYFEK